MVTATVDMEGFNLGMRGLITKVGLEGKVVVKKEAAELIKTLVKISPPDDKEKTKQKIDRDIRSRFTMAADFSNAHFDVMGKSGVKWYGVTSAHLYGMAPELDKRRASVAELEAMRFQISAKTGRLTLPFKHPRKHQTVILSQRIVTSAKTVNRLITKIQQNVGRLKAGWLVATKNGTITLSGGNMPPKWVTKHASNARGRFVNGLSDKSPSFTIANFAKGVGMQKVNHFVSNAVAIRAEAMKENARQILLGKKQYLSEFA